MTVRENEIIRDRIYLDLKPCLFSTIPRRRADMFETEQESGTAKSRSTWK